MLGFLGIVGFIAFVVFGIMWIISLVKKNGKAIRNFLISGAGLVVMIIASLIGVGSVVNEVMNEVDEPKQIVEKNKNSNDAEVNNEDPGKEEKEEKKEKEEKEENDDVPREHKAALSKAETYSSMMHMSKAAIYDQLVSEHGENFPEDAAEYAINNIEADWKENALNKARTYAEEMDMSNDAIFEQLISEHGEQFTEEEAQYAIDNLE